MRGKSKIAGFIVALTLLVLTAPVWADPACVPIPTPIRPIASTHTIPPYPEASQRLGEEGRTVLRVEIGPDGIPDAVTTQISSGTVRLDSAAEEFVKGNWKWQPVVNNCGPVKAVTLVSIAWNLSDAPKQLQVELFATQADFPLGAIQKLEQGGSVVALSILPPGQPQSPVLETSSGFPDLDAQAFAVVRNHKWAPAQMDGKPVPTTLHIVVRWNPPGTPASN